jgi:ATPase subunit of ABC transporter with duplicated ATPase domains
VQKQKRLAQESREDESRQRTIEREREWVSASPKARQAKSKARIQRYEDLVARAEERGPSAAQIVIPIKERLGTNVIEFTGCRKASATRTDQGPVVQAAAGRDRRRDRSERRRQDDAVPHDHRSGDPGRGTMKVGDTVHLGYVDQSRDTLAPNKTVYEEISGGNEIIHLGKREMNARAYCGAFNFKGPTSRRRSANSRR